MPLQARGLTQTKAWLTRRKAGLKKAVATLAQPESLVRYHSDANRIVEAVVYAAYDPGVYQRTFELLSSVGAVQISQDPPVAGVTIDLTDGARAILPPGDVNYARFMLPAGYGSAANANNSFLNGKAPLPRDFFAVWLEHFGHLVPADVQDAVDRELKK